MPFTEIPADLIELKREQIAIMRATKELNQAIKSVLESSNPER